MLVDLGRTVITTVEVTGPQGPGGSFVVSVRVTVPLVIEGVYKELSELIFENVPLGALHVELVAPPPRLPDKATVPPAQTVLGGPAFAVALPTVTTMVETLAGQIPAGSFDVSVSVTVPLVMDGV